MSKKEQSVQEYINQKIKEMWNIDTTPAKSDSETEPVSKKTITDIDLDQAKSFLVETIHYLDKDPSIMNNGFDENMEQEAMINYSKAVDCLYDETYGVFPLKLSPNQIQKYLPKFVFNQVWMDWYKQDTAKAVNKLYEVIVKLDRN